MGYALRLQQLHADLGGSLLVLLELRGQIVLDDHRLQDRVGVFFLSVVGQFVAQNDYCLRFLNKTSFEVSVVQGVTFDVDHASGIRRLHELHFKSRVRPLRHHYHTVSVVFSVILVKILF